MTLAAIVLVGLAAYRATRLVTTDTLTDPIRDALYHWAWDDEHPRVVVLRSGEQVQEPSPRGPVRTWLYELATCPHCVGVWAAAGAYAWWSWWGSARWAIWVAAIAGVVSLCASAVSRLERT